MFSLFFWGGGGGGGGRGGQNFEFHCFRKMNICGGLGMKKIQSIFGVFLILFLVINGCSLRGPSLCIL